MNLSDLFRKHRILFGLFFFLCPFISLGLIFGWTIILQVIMGTLFGLWFGLFITYGLFLLFVAKDE